MKKFLLTSISLLLVGCGKAYEKPNYETALANYPTIIKTQTKTSTCTCKKKVAGTTTTSSDTKTDTTKSTTEKPTSTTNKVEVKSPVVTSKPEEKSTLSQEELTKQLYKKAIDKMMTMKSFKTNIRNYNKGYLYKKEPVKEAKVANSVNYVVFERPRKLFMKIVESEVPSLLNTKLYTDGGPNVKIKVPGLLGLFTFTFPVDKPDLTSYRGYTILDIDPVSLENRLNDKAGKIKLLGSTTVNGEQAYLFEITNIKMLDDKITKEILGVRQKDFSLMLHEMYEGEELVFQNIFEDLIYDAPVTEEDFKV